VRDREDLFRRAMLWGLGGNLTAEFGGDVHAYSRKRELREATIGGALPGSVCTLKRGGKKGHKGIYRERYVKKKEKA